MSRFELYDYGLNHKAAQAEIEFLQANDRLALDHPMLMLVKDIYKKLEALADAENETRQVVQEIAEKVYQIPKGGDSND